MVVPDNASLVLTKQVPDRGLPFTSQYNKPRFEAVTTCVPPEAYVQAYARWAERIEQLPGTALAATFTVDGRMIVGIGADTILESLVAMNRLWGMPLIPGSALKGLASHYTASLPDGIVSPDQREDLFGTPEVSGCVTWLDAWYVPDNLNTSPFTLDVVTVHHQSYYQDARNPPWDFEDPIPSYFISVRGTFLVAVQAPDQGWAHAAMNILTRALDEWGIGAKTNAGYGRLLFRDYQSPWVKEAEEAAAARSLVAARAAQADRELQELFAEIEDPAVQANLRANHWVEVWSGLPDDRKTEVGTLIHERLVRKPSDFFRITGRRLPNYPGQPGEAKGYVKPLLAWMDEHAPDVSKP